MKRIAMSLFLVMNIFSMEQKKENSEIEPLIMKTNSDEKYTLKALPKDQSKINLKPLIESINRNESELVRQYFDQQMGWIEQLRSEHIKVGNEKDDQFNILNNKELFTRTVLSYVDGHIAQQEKLKRWGDNCLALIKPEESNCKPFTGNVIISAAALLASIFAGVVNAPLHCPLEFPCASRE